MAGREVAFAVVGLVVGVAVGSGGLWFASRPTALSRETAQALINAEYSKRGGATCVWTEPTKKTDTRWTFAPYDKNTRTCAQAMLNERFIDPGPCQETGCTGGCCAQWVNAVEPAKFELASPDGISFPCGTFELAGVTSVMTVGAEATVKFERTFNADSALLQRLESCKMDKPIVGRTELTRTYRRGDDGAWREP